MPWLFLPHHEGNVHAMSEAALKDLIRAVADVKRDDPMAPVTVIVPNNLAGRTVGWRLAAGLGDGRRGIAGIRITTLARMAESVAARHLHPRRPLLPSILTAAWRAELSAAARAQEPWVFADVWDHPATVSALVQAYRDLREVREAELPAEPKGTVPAETIRLAGLVRSRLAGDWYDQQDLFARASDLTTVQPGVFGEFGTLVRYLVGEETRSAQEFVGALEAAFRVTTISEADATLGPLTDRVLHASDSDDEVRMVVREVVASLTEGHLARRLAIVYSRPDPYVRLLPAQLRAAGIEHNGRGGVAVAELACSRAFLGLLDLPARHYPRPRVFEVLSTWPMRQLGLGAPIHTLRWERVSREANIAGGEPSDAIAAGWVRRLADFASQAEERKQQASEDWQRQRLDRTIVDARELGAFLGALDARLSEIDQASSWEAVSGLCIALLGDLFGSIDEIRAWDQDGKRAYATLHSLLTGLSSLDAHSNPTGLASVRDVIGAQLEAAIPRTGKFGQGVFVGPVSQALGLDLDRIWVVGMSEDLYPGSQREDALLPEQVRDRTPGLLSSADRIARSRHELEAALQTAALATVSFPRGDLRKSSERLPSRLLLPTLRHLTGDPDLPATEWHKAARVDGILESPSFAGSVTTTGTPSTDQEWAVRSVAAGGDLDDPPFRAGRGLRAARLGDGFTRFDGNLAGVEDLPDLAASGRLTSPTALEGYAACPFAYFVKRLLKVEPVIEPTATGRISPLDLGNIFHYAMDRFLHLEKEAGTLPGRGEPWRPEHHERLLSVAEGVIAEHGEAGRLGHVTLWGFEEPRVHQDLRRMLTDDSSWRVANGSEPVDSELAFGFGEHPPVEIEVAGGTVKFVGSADKIDRAGTTVYVTDIKSGGRGPFTKIERGGDPTVGGTKLQLPIYAKAAKEAYGADVVEARYWFVREQGSRNQISLELTEELEATFSHVVGTLARGMARGHFFKKPSKEPGYLWVDCEFCTPGGAAHAQTRSGYERKSVHPDLLNLLELIDPEAAARARTAAGAESE